jgi:hypothetical protein
MPVSIYRCLGGVVSVRWWTAIYAGISSLFAGLVATSCCVSEQRLIRWGILDVTIL